MEAIKKIEENTFYDSKEGFLLDMSTALVSVAELEQRYGAEIERSLEVMQELEAGGIANPDEDRMVGHYWLRSPERSPSAEISAAIKDTAAAIDTFVQGILQGTQKVAGKVVSDVIIAGIGGSALGPQFLQAALEPLEAKIKIHYLDNTDPAGYIDTLAQVANLASSLSIVISKSGGTRETRNAMLWLEHCYQNAGLQPGEHMVAVTQEGSALFKHAQEHNWLPGFPMWDWVGGRVSIWSAVGLLPTGLMGINTSQLLAGAAHMDALTRAPALRENPALMLALAWYHLGNKKGERALIMLPYRDQLEKLSKYCQQLVMESIGKSKDLSGAIVNQGLYVLGNKGSTDQHSYIQQLRDGLDNFIAHFIEVRLDVSSRAQQGASVLQHCIIENDATVGDYLLGFQQGTRQALYEANRPGILLSIPQVSEFSVGALVALFERAVGFYSTLIHVNAYNQPGVEAGKKAAERILEVQALVLNCLKENQALTIEEILASLDLESEAASVYAILRHLSANKRVSVSNEETRSARRYSLGESG